MHINLLWIRAEHRDRQLPEAAPGQAALLHARRRRHQSGHQWLQVKTIFIIFVVCWSHGDELQSFCCCSQSCYISGKSPILVQAILYDNERTDEWMKKKHGKHNKIRYVCLSIAYLYLHLSITTSTWTAAFPDDVTTMLILTVARLLDKFVFNPSQPRRLCWNNYFIFWGICMFCISTCSILVVVLYHFIVFYLLTTFIYFLHYHLIVLLMYICFVYRRRNYSGIRLKEKLTMDHHL